MTKARIETQIMPRGMSLDQAAAYIGCGPTKYSDLVRKKLMPGPRMMDGMLRYDRVAIDIAFSDLPNQATNAIDEAMGRH